MALSTPIAQIELALDGLLDRLVQTNPFGDGKPRKPRKPDRERSAADFIGFLRGRKKAKPT